MMVVSLWSTLSVSFCLAYRNRNDIKEAQTYDYADLEVPMLQRMFQRRSRGYWAMGYAVEE